MKRQMVSIWNVHTEKEFRAIESFLADYGIPVELGGAAEIIPLHAPVRVPAHRAKQAGELVSANFGRRGGNDFESEVVAS